jgi:soluble lytic murein transglycosylase-like protein
MWGVARTVRKRLGALPWWQQAALVAATPLLALNLSVALLGQSAVFPLSPFFVPEKWEALKAYARHRPSCLLSGHRDLAPAIARAERDAGLPPGLMRAVVEVESGGRVHRISPAGAMGPAQLMPGTCASLKVRDCFDPEESISAGARYLASLLARSHDVRLAVAAYNAGPGAVNGAVPRNGQTEAYVARVMERYRRRD